MPPSAPLHILRLEAHDLPAVARFFLALDPADRRARFHAAFTDAAIAAYVARIDPVQGVLLGAFDTEGALLGLAEAYPTDAAAMMELAVTVHAAWRGCGIGRMLARRAAALAFASGARAIALTIGAHPAISRVAAGLGAASGLGTTVLQREAARLAGG